ncbi:TauD/TfdA family dioxygenase [Micromonospora sp. NPDC047074]|uniref:TauD/TfdA family dioxygenase n=1 Tax=Micromonospora sp. NPDC047074 TaxID=3154339 RepID=UPI0034056F53
MPEPSIPMLTGDPSPATIHTVLAERGALLLRDPQRSAAEFAAIGDALMTAVPYANGLHDERDVVSADATTTTVTRGLAGMPLHREASYAPGSPDVLTFMCVRPADDGGATTLCDGVELLAALPRPVRAEFEDMHLVWESTLEPERWHRMFGTTDRDEVVAAIRQWEPYLRPWEGIGARFTAAGALTTWFRTRCTPPTYFGGEPAFCNSLLISRPGEDEYQEQRLSVRTGTGDRVPEELIVEVATAASDRTFAVPWQAGDVLVVDNSRYLHGRQAFQDPGRSVLVRMGLFGQPAEEGVDPGSRPESEREGEDPA